MLVNIIAVFVFLIIITLPTIMVFVIPAIILHWIICISLRPERERKRKRRLEELEALKRLLSNERG